MLPVRARLMPALALPVLLLAGCAGLETAPDAPAMPDPARADGGAVVAAPQQVLPALSAGPAGQAPLARPAAARPEAYDQSSIAERAAAAAPVSAQSRRLGDTIASLGDPTRQGFWIRTPLVDAPGKGRLVDPASGKSVNVDLLPREGAAAGGSLVSLAALQMLGVSLTGLPRLEVYAQ